MYARLRCSGNLPLCLAFGTGEGHLWYGICVPCSKRLPGVRDAFSEAFGVKNRLLRYRRDIRCAEQASVVRDAFSEALGAQNSLLRYGRDIRYRKRPPLVRDASSKAREQPTPQTVNSLLGYATHFRKRAVPKAAPAAPDVVSVRETAPLGCEQT